MRPSVVVAALLFSAVSVAEPTLLPEEKAWASMNREQLMIEDHRLRLSVPESIGGVVMQYVGGGLCTVGTGVIAFSMSRGSSNPRGSNGAFGMVFGAIGGALVEFVGLLLLTTGLVKHQLAQRDRQHIFDLLTRVDERIVGLDRAPPPVPMTP
jgi:hypothetical protein